GGRDGSVAGGQTGSMPSAWSCVGGTQNGANITVGLGESATCTINNNDNPPALHLRKVVVNNNGGTAADTDWTLNAAGPTPLSGSTPDRKGGVYAHAGHACAEDA